MELQTKVRENRLRRMAERQALRLIKSRRRDPRAVDYGLYTLVEVLGNHVVADGLTIDQIEHELTGVTK